MKKKYSLALATVLFALNFCAFAITGKYKIQQVDYKIEGSTRQYALEQNLLIDQDRIFQSEDELVAYIADLRIKLISERVFKKTSVDYTISPAPDNTGIYGVTLLIRTEDSHNMLAMPYPKYNTNDGFTFKLKIKDMNFLGSMESMSGETILKYEREDDNSYSYVFGGGLTFELPFRLAVFDSSWTNDYSVTYTIGDSTPEWSAQTGLSFTLPFKSLSLCLDLEQTSTRDFDYEEYGDSTYFTEYAKFSVPFNIQYIDNWGKVKYTPFVSFTYNWDRNGINEDNSDLIGPAYTIGHTISSSRVDWIGNFRDGISASAEQSFTYNNTAETFAPFVSGELEVYKAYKYAGLCMDIYAFGYLNDAKKIGDRLRGILDDQYFSVSSGHSDEYACKTPAAIVVNLDLPIHVITTDWENWGLGFLHSLNFELQFSPFFDFALVHNVATGTTFDYRDGFYASGFEFLVFPERWRSIQVRASLGVDVGRKFLSSKLNTSWRRSVSPYQIDIGIGLHY
jgi:hypothetical protein